MTSLVRACLLFLVVVAQDTSPGGPVHDGQPDDCNAWHTVVEGDTCDTIPEKYDLTREQFQEWNPAVSDDCIENFWLGSAYCVGVGELSPPSSTLSLDSSSTIVGTSLSTSFTTSAINTTYTSNVPIITWNLTTTSIDTSYPPTATQPGQPAECKRWHLVGTGDTCDGLAKRYQRSMTLGQLHEWNPELHGDCSGLYTDWFICVAIRGGGPDPDLEWSTSTTDFTTPPEPSSHQPTSWPPVNSSFSPVPSQGPMPDNCRNWHQVAADENCDSILTVYTYITKDQFFEWNPVLNGDCNSLWQNNWYCVAAFDSDYPLPPTVTATPSPIPDNSPRDCAHWYFLPTEDTCQSIAEIFGTFDAQDFVSWNPSVYDDCSNIKADTWYCVGRPDTPTTRTEGAPTQTEPGESMPTQSGITEPCSEYWLVSNTDTCESIASDSGVTEDALLEWNPALGPECEGLLPDHYICVGISSSTTNAPPTQTGSTATTSPRPTSTSDGAPISTPSPVREGMVSGCRRFYLQHPGEACWDMAQKAGISVDDFLKWNPAVGAECGNVWPEYYYCVGVSGPETTIMERRATRTS